PSTSEFSTLSLHDALPIWMLAHLQLHVGQLVPPAVQLCQRPIEPSAQVLDVVLDLPRRPRLGRGALVVHARRSFAHSASSFRVRSEEHTSELQSPCNLVCR